MVWLSSLYFSIPEDVSSSRPSVRSPHSLISVITQSKRIQRAQSSRRAYPQSGGRTCVPPSAPPSSWAESSATRMSRKRNDSFGRSTPRRSAEAAARHSSLGGFRTPGQLARTEPGIVPSSASSSRGPRVTLRPGAAWSAPRRQKRRGSGPRLNAAATLPVRQPRPPSPAGQAP